MIIGRVAKHPDEVRRWIADFGEWLDDGEVVESITTPEVDLLPAAWSGPWPAAPEPQQIALLPDDPTPLATVSSEVAAEGRYVTVFYDGGTDGNRYVLSYTATGSSGRTKVVAIEVQATASSVELLA